VDFRCVYWVHGGCSESREGDSPHGDEPGGTTAQAVARASSDKPAGPGCGSGSFYPPCQLCRDGAGSPEPRDGTPPGRGVGRAAARPQRPADRGGLRPIYRETGLDAPGMAQFRRALDFILRQQEPYPAIVLDRHWNILLTNEGAGRLMGVLLDPATAAALGPPNALRLVYHPQALRPYIVNWEATAAALIQWLHRDLLRSADTEIRRLLEELLAYPDVPRNWRTLDLDASPAPFLAIEVHKDDTRLKFFTTLTSLGTPYDITLHELRIESFFPADDATDASLRRLSAAS
ncbi:MAG TPA: hypothetical protein VFL31_07075, partial [Nitrospiraceae bacterium]|nr:hypothetical protein [Nitrospiraceae bacterium]